MGVNHSALTKKNRGGKEHVGSYQRPLTLLLLDTVTLEPVHNVGRADIGTAGSLWDAGERGKVEKGEKGERKG